MMKKLLPFLLSCTLAAAVADPVADAVRKHPSLAVEGTAMQRAFVEAHRAARRKDPRLFLDPAWAVKMADACAEDIHRRETEKRQAIIREGREAEAEKVRQSEVRRYAEPRLQAAMREASRRLLMAPLSDQLQVAAMARYQRENPGPMKAAEFMALSEKSRWLIAEYAPGLLPVEMWR